MSARVVARRFDGADPGHRRKHFPKVQFFWRQFVCKVRRSHAETVEIVEYVEDDQGRQVAQVRPRCSRCFASTGEPRVTANRGPKVRG